MKLIIIYNADSGLFSAMADTVQKIVAPEGYDCHLCALTQGHLGMRREWRQFLDNLDVDVECLHRDEFLRAYPGQSFQFPCIVRKDTGGVFTELITAPEVNSITDVDQLMTVIRQRIQ